ncbi:MULTISPECIES: hypothetical protein [unclassified Streptomyces]|uniref:hypothetical protein n=1 Tax=unclassified Streptomyces TaxID=2593676 RepID=UPI003247B31B
MGQTPAQKAAKAARGRHPKKRPGRAQREAIKRAQAAKEAGGGKPAAKKAAVAKKHMLRRSPSADVNTLVQRSGVPDVLGRGSVFVEIPRLMESLTHAYREAER